MDRIPKGVWIAMATVWTVSMLAGSLVSLDSLGGGSLLPLPHGDKVIHLTAYAGFSFLWSISLEVRSRRELWLIVGIGFVIGTVIEILQYYVTVNRRFEILDIIANVTGLVLGTVAYIGLSKT